MTPPSTPHRGRRFPLKLALLMDHVIPWKTRSHPRAKKRSSPRNQRATRGKNKRRASNFDVLLAGLRRHYPLRWYPHMPRRRLPALRAVPRAIDWPRVRRPQRRLRSARSRSHRPHTTRSRVSLSHNTCRRCHLGCHRIQGTLPAEAIPKHLPHS
jgi:hypothetical protein